jgi:superfamily II DNA or RNA helicase
LFDTTTSHHSEAFSPWTRQLASLRQGDSVMSALELRPYQLEAVEAIRTALTRHRSTLLVLATGLGKTVTFGEVARRVAARGRRTLVLAHRGELLEQAAGTLRRFELDVAIEQGERRVDPAALPSVVVASVQTLKGKRLATYAPDAFGLIVIDEAHHATATSYRAVLDHFAAAKVLGVTATPDRGDSVGLRRVFESVAYRVDLAQGIADGWLAPLELRTVVVDSLDISSVRTTAGDFAAGQLEAELMRDGVLHEVAAPLAELSAGRQTIAFVAGVQQAHALASVLGGYGVAAAAVDGSMSPQGRASVLQDFRSGRVRVVANAMLWTEGFDAPETECVALVRPTRSRSLLVQMIGRGTRLAEGKGSCLILDFVPGTVASVRLAGPADALADGEVSAYAAARVRELSRGGASLTDVLERARAEDAQAHAAELEAERQKMVEARRLVQQVGVIYAAPRMDMATLLSCIDDAPDSLGSRDCAQATPGEIAHLREAGFKVPDMVTRTAAHALIRVVAQRRAEGLCTVKQAKRLRNYGLRDDLSFHDAREALDAIAANGWKPPVHLYRDPRFVAA